MSASQRVSRGFHRFAVLSAAIRRQTTAEVRAVSRFGLVILLLLLGTLPLAAFSDAELVDRYCGAGIVAGADSASRKHILDFAPTMLARMNVQRPAQMKGRVWGEFVGH
jgi:hypothetical protein